MNPTPTNPPRPARTILLMSGWQTINIGDVGHTPGTLRYLEQHLPGARVIVWLRRSNEPITAMLRRRFPQVGMVRGQLDADGRATTPELSAAFDAADLFVHNSGMPFNRFWPPPLGPVHACLARGLPFGLYGQSFDGFAPADEPAMAELLSRAAFIFCRDGASLAYLRGIGTRPPVLEFGPDGCFGIDVRDDERADTFLAERKLEAGQFITVTIRTNTPKLGLAGAGAGAGAGDVLNPALPSAEHIAEDERWAGYLRSVIVNWVRRTGRRVLLAPEVDKEIEPARRLLLERLPADVRPAVAWRDVFWNVDEAASVYARARAVVSMEPHSCIMALANGTPAIHAFSRKHGVKAGMFRDIGLGDWLFDIDADPAERVADTLVRGMDAAPDAARDRAGRAMAFVNARSAEMMSHVGRALGRDG